MTSDFFAPINMSGPYFNECDLFVRRGTPEGELSLDLDLEIPTDSEYLEEDGFLVLPHELKVRVSLTEHPDDDEPREAMHVNLSMGGTVSTPMDADVSRDGLETYLLFNGISLFYSSARSYIEMLTAQSPMGRFTIPPIDPKKYLDMARSGDAEA